VSLDLLRTFHAVYRSGTVTAGARLLGFSQPGVTAQLRALESQVGQQLFVRGARGVRATEAAHDLARRLDGPLDALADVAADLRRDPAVRGRTLRLGGPADLTTTRVLPALAPTVAAGVTVRTSLGLADELLAGLVASRLDLVVSAVRPRQRGLHAEPLFDEEFVLVAAPGVVDTALLATAPARAVAAVPLLAYAEELPITRRWWRHVLGIAPPRRAAVVVPDLRGVLAMALAGAGAAVLPRYLCTEQLASGELEAVLDGDDPPINTLYLAARTTVRNEPHIDLAWATLRAAALDW
jgi:DNA-binding transcriptional LysR family regulator